MDGAKKDPGTATSGDRPLVCDEEGSVKDAAVDFLKDMDAKKKIACDYLENLGNDLIQQESEVGAKPSMIIHRPRPPSQARWAFTWPSRSD